MIEKKAFIDRKARKKRKASKKRKRGTDRVDCFIEGEAEDDDDAEEEEKEDVKEEKKEKKKGKKRTPLTFIFHNARSYDTNLIMKEVYRRPKLRIKAPIFSGRKILKVVIGTGHVSSNGDIRIIDSLSFLSGSLRSLAKDWIPAEEGKALIRKGWFPHKFNTLEPGRHDYEGSIPRLALFYESPLDDLDFYFWWLDQTMESTETVESLHSDFPLIFILPLNRPISQLRDLMSDRENNLWRANPICTDQAMGQVSDPIDDIHLRHFNDTLPKDKTGQQLVRLLLKYFEYHSYVMEEKKGDNKYYKQKWLFRDNFLGYLKQDVNVLFHVFNNFRNLAMTLPKFFPLKKDPIDPLHYFTLAAWANVMFRNGFMGEGEIARSDREQADWMRQWMFGARTENFALLFKAVEGKNKALSFDVSSMYPFVMSRRPFPVGPLVRLKKATMTDVDRLYAEGKLFIALVKVVCPKKCRVPVLPRRSFIPNSDGNPTSQYKLLFDLVDGDRYATCVELKKAIEVGYIVTEVKELGYWMQSSSDIFAPYMNLFYLLKTAAGGWKKILDELPPEKQCEMKGKEVEEKKQIARDYFDEKSITKLKQIEEEGWLSMDSKSSLKAMSKLCLNTLWGKLVQRDDLPHLAFLRTDIEADIKKWRSLQKQLEDGKIKDLEFHGICDDISLGLRVQWDDDVSDLIHKGDVARSAVQMGIFTTAHARVHLYECLTAVANR